MTTTVVDVALVTNVIEIIQGSTEVIDNNTTSIVTEDTKTIQVIDVNTSSIEIVESISTREIVDTTSTSNSMEVVSTTTEVVSETIPVLYGDEDVPYSKRVDFIDDNLLYRGEAPPGTPTNAASWRLRKVTIGIDGDVTEEWASGNSLFNKVWDDRLIYSYS